MEKYFHGCPWREKESAQGAKSFSCRGCRVDTLAEVRRHAKRYHVSFIQLCRTCNRHFLDQDNFELEHGYDGKRCRDPQKQARGEIATKAQWRELYNMAVVNVLDETSANSTFSPKIIQYKTQLRLVSDHAISNTVATAAFASSTGENTVALQPKEISEQASREHDNGLDNFHGTVLRSSLSELETPRPSANVSFSVPGMISTDQLASRIHIPTPMVGS